MEKKGGDIKHFLMPSILWHTAHHLCLQTIVKIETIINCKFYTAMLLWLCVKEVIFMLSLVIIVDPPFGFNAIDPPYGMV